MDSPILLVVDEDPQVLAALSGDLGRRFAPDYQILTEPSPVSALAVLEQLATASRPVALVVAGQQITGTSGVELLEAAHRLHPAAKRVLRLERGDYTAANPAVRAMTLGQIDYHLFTPWLPAERWLYPPVTDFLADWSRKQPPSFVAFRIVGRQWEARSHQLREVLTRLAFPYEFYAHDSEAGRQLLAEAGQDGRRLPVMVFRTGQVLVDPSHAELAELLGASTRPQGGHYDLAIVGAGPAGLAAAVSAASEGLRRRSPASAMRDATDCVHDDGAPHRRGGDVRRAGARALARRCAEGRRATCRRACDSTSSGSASSARAASRVRPLTTLISCSAGRGGRSSRSASPPAL